MLHKVRGFDSTLKLQLNWSVNEPCCSKPWVAARSSQRSSVQARLQQSASGKRAPAASMPAVEHDQSASGQDDGKGCTETAQSRAAFVRARNRAYQALYRARFKVRCHAALQLHSNENPRCLGVCICIRKVLVRLSLEDMIPALRFSTWIISVVYLVQSGKGIPSSRGMHPSVLVLLDSAL